MSGKPSASASAPISSVKEPCLHRVLRIRFLPTRRFVRCTWVRISNCRLGPRTTMLKPSLQLRVGQQLTMTPQLQQAIRLLQLPSLDLQAHVREALETNVMLEADDEVALEGPADTLREPGREPEGGSGDERDAELDGNTAPVEQSEAPEGEIADESWGESGGGPADTSWSGDDDRSGDFSDRQGQTLQ